MEGTNLHDLRNCGGAWESVMTAFVNAKLCTSMVTMQSIDRKLDENNGIYNWV
jgi:hypothetical protein